MSDATAAIAEFGYTGAQGEHMVVVENTPAVHNIVVCTLCSCYPWPVLGLPPAWYKSARLSLARRDRSARSAAEFGVELGETSRCACGTARGECATRAARTSGGDRGNVEEHSAEIVTRDE